MGIAAGEQASWLLTFLVVHVLLVRCNRFDPGSCARLPYVSTATFVDAAGFPLPIDVSVDDGLLPDGFAAITVLAAAGLGREARSDPPLCSVGAYRARALG
jgi:hypothetical protein